MFLDSSWKKAKSVWHEEGIQMPMRLSHCWTREEMKSYGCVRCQLKQLSEHRNSFQPVVRIKKEKTCIHVNQIVEFFHHRLQSSSLICFCCHVGSRTQTTALLWKAKLYLLGELMNWCTWNISVSIRLTLSSNTMRMNDWSQWQHNIYFKKKTETPLHLKHLLCFHHPICFLLPWMNLSLL